MHVCLISTVLQDMNKGNSCDVLKLVGVHIPDWLRAAINFADPHKLLADKLTSLVSELVSILKGCRGDDELLGHVVSTLRTLVLNHPAAVEECQRAEHRLQDILQGTLDMWSPSEHKVCGNKCYLS